MTTDATITILGQEYTVQCFARLFDKGPRDEFCIGITAIEDPIDVQDWPHTAAQLEAIAAAKAEKHGISTSSPKEDRDWIFRGAVQFASEQHQYEIATTREERETAQVDARHESHVRGPIDYDEES